MFAKDFTSQFIWALALGGLGLSWFLKDSGQYGTWFYLGLVPFALSQWIVAKWAGKTEGPGIWVLAMTDNRLQNWPRLDRFVRKWLYTEACYAHLRQNPQKQNPHAPNPERNRP